MGDKLLDIPILHYCMGMLVKEHQDGITLSEKATIIVSDTISWSGILN